MDNEKKYWCRFSYGIVKEERVNGFIVENEDGFIWAIDKEVADKELMFSGQYASTQIITLTELEQIFRENTRIIMKVCFNKKPKVEDISQKIIDLYPNKGGKTGILSKNDFEIAAKEIAKDVTIGEERIIIGRHYGKPGYGGRIQFVDMEDKFKEKASERKSSIKQVDPRSLNWIIVGNVRYVAKKYNLN